MAAGAIWIINLIDAAILPPAWGRKVKISAIQDNNNGVGLNLSVQW